MKAEEWANRAMGLPNGPEYPNREIHARVADTITLAQQEARAERDREWREAVMAADACAAEDLAYGLHVGKHIVDAACYRNCGCTPLRALLEGK